MLKKGTFSTNSLPLPDKAYLPACLIAFKPAPPAFKNLPGPNKNAASSTIFLLGNVTGVPSEFNAGELKKLLNLDIISPPVTAPPGS